jgi:hypothetical protein
MTISVSINYMISIVGTKEVDSASNSEKEGEQFFSPGAFACNVVWETQFILHPRLKTGPAKRGIQALKSVLTRFAVNNRKNMFVYQETSGNVFYLRYYGVKCTENNK